MSPGRFHPGERVPTSGIYRACHQAHRAAHLVTAITGERFPECRTCGREVTFELVEAALYVVEERDFRGMFLGS